MKKKKKDEKRTPLSDPIVYPSSTEYCFWFCVKSGWRLNCVCCRGVCTFTPVCDMPWMCLLSVRLHFYTYIRLYIWTHSSRNASYRLALPGPVFLARPWVKSLLLLTEPCKSVSLSLSHTFLLLLHGKAVVFPLSFWLLLQSILIFMVLFSFALVYGHQFWDSRGVDPLLQWGVLTCLLVHVY